ncbi:MAG TPA: hypothetical protein V6C69_00815 [Trichormus sp.]
MATRKNSNGGGDLSKRPKPSGKSSTPPGTPSPEAKPKGPKKKAADVDLSPADIVWALMETADLCDDDDEALEIYARATQLAEHNLPKQKPKGNLWSDNDWRTYLTARARLASILWTIGERQLALKHFRQLVELNPQNNMSMCQVLASALFDMGCDKELEKMLDRQLVQDPCATYFYTKALLLYRQLGDCEQSNEALLVAMQYNYFVPLYLFSQLPLPPEPPDTIGEGDDREAISYVMDNAESWAETEGAAEWMAERINVLAQLAKKSRKRK